jgi:hypothetical protein
MKLFQQSVYGERGLAEYCATFPRVSGSIHDGPRVEKNEFQLFIGANLFFFIGAVRQGCQMVCFQTKNPNLGKFWSALE